MMQRKNLYWSYESVSMTQSLIEQFLDDKEACGRQPQTIQAYRRSLQDLYEFLPKEKEITKGVLEDWTEALKNRGYSTNSVNMKLVAANGLLRYCGAGLLRATYEQVERDETTPGLARSEYLLLLSAAHELEKEREYLLIKVFACIGLNISELNCLTVEAVKAGTVCQSDGKEKYIPESFREELLSYANRQEVKSGIIFVTRSGKPLDRSNITNAIRRIAEKTRLNPKRCNPRALHRLYQATHEEMLEEMESVYEQSFEKLLIMEQSLLGWN